MAQQTINIGSTADDGTGDPLRTAFQKSNDNFDELYAEGRETLTASEAISAAMFVNIHSSSGAKVRKANATDDTKPCDGYAPAAISNAATGSIVGPGRVIDGLTGMTPGSDVYLDTTGGGWTHTPPLSSGNLVQKLGKAVSATKLFFNPLPGVTL